MLDLKILDAISRGNVSGLRGLVVRGRGFWKKSSGFRAPSYFTQDISVPIHRQFETEFGFKECPSPSSVWDIARRYGTPEMVEVLCAAREDEVDQILGCQEEMDGAPREALSDLESYSSTPLHN